MKVEIDWNDWKSGIEVQLSDGAPWRTVASRSRDTVWFLLDDSVAACAIDNVTLRYVRSNDMTLEKEVDWTNPMVTDLYWRWRMNDNIKEVQHETQRIDFMGRDVTELPGLWNDRDLLLLQTNLWHPTQSSGLHTNGPATWWFKMPGDKEWINSKTCKRHLLVRVWVEHGWQGLMNMAIENESH